MDNNSRDGEQVDDMDINNSLELRAKDDTRITEIQESGQVALKNQNTSGTSPTKQHSNGASEMQRYDLNLTGQSFLPKVNIVYNLADATDRQRVSGV